MSHQGRSASALLVGVSTAALIAAFLASSGRAQEAAGGEGAAITLDPVTVVSTAPARQSTPVRQGAPARQAAPAPRIAQQADPQPTPQPQPIAEPTQQPTDVMPAVDTLGPVSTVRPQQLQQIMPTTTSDALRGIPGVATPTRGDDPATAINIRGLQDFGRVNVLVDGARQNFQRSGHNANGMFYLESELISTIDVVRGPVANVFGSGAIGGIASFRTKDVEDVLKAGERWGVLLNATGSSNIGSVSSAFGAARLSPNAEIFAGGTYRKQGNYQDGDGNKIPNTGNEVTTGVLKTTFRPADGHQVKLGYINYYADYATGQPFPPGTPPPAASIYGTITRNEIATGRWTYARPDDRLFNFDGSVYWSKTATDQAKIDGTPDAVTGRIGDRRNFTINTYGFDFNNTLRFDVGPLRNAFTVGMDSFQDFVDTTGFGTIFTPGGARTVSGAFAQMKTNAANIIEVIAAARYDKYDLRSTGTIGTNGVAGSSGDRVSPKITIRLTPIPGITPYFIYAEGYRAPAVTETFVSGVHPVAPNFTLLPNPGLNPEVGKNKEFGLNLRSDNIWLAGDAFRAKFNVYQNDLYNYIDLKFIGAFQAGQGGQTCVNFVVFFCEQYQNIPRARIQGYEFETLYDAGSWFVGVAGTLFQRGRNLTNNLPLATIVPNQVTTTLGARLLDRKLTMAVRWQAVDAKNANDIPPGAEAPAGAKQGPPYAYFPTWSYNLVNVYVGYQINPDTLVSLSAENLLNQQYAPYLNVTPSPFHGTNSTPLPFFSPGLTVKAALTYRFSDQTLNPTRLADLR
jgi:hemoglobin/transferrin/lactoferrin receptor protein